MKKESFIQVDSLPPKLGQVPAVQRGRHSSWLVLFFAVVIVACGGIRFAWQAIDFDSLHQDPDAYKALAEGLASSGTLGRIGDAGVTATAYRPPGYIWALSWLVFDNKLSEFRVSIFQGILGTLTCIFVARIAYLLSGSWSFAVFASLAVAVDPILLKQSSLVMTETLATFITVVLWWSWVELTKAPRSIWVMMLSMILIGVLAGIGCLVRPTTFVWIAVWFFSSVCLQGIYRLNSSRFKLDQRESRPSSGASICYSPRLSSWFGFFIGVAVVIGPWAYRNFIQIGQWTMTTTHGGYTLLLANNPVLYENIQKHGWDRQWDESRFHSLWDQRSLSDPRTLEFWTATPESLQVPESHQVTESLQVTEAKKSIDFQFGNPGEHREVADDRLASEVAWKTIQRDPITFLKSCFVRMSWFWAVTPYQSGATSWTVMAVGRWYCLLFGGIIVACLGLASLALVRFGGLWTAYSQSLGFWVPAFSLVVSLQLVHSVYWSNMRMRAPLMPILYVFLAIAVFLAWQLARRRSSSLSTNI